MAVTGTRRIPSSIATFDILACASKECRRAATTKVPAGHVAVSTPGAGICWSDRDEAGASTTAARREDRGSRSFQDGVNMRTMAGIVLGYLTLGPAGTALAWGPEGHAVIADVAAAHLSQKAKTGVKKLLGHSTMAGVSSWADVIRPVRPETYNWHFVDVEVEDSDYAPARDCKDTPKGDCAIAAIERFRTVLADKTATKSARLEALKFLVHFVGDVHQPLHCADHHDRGGNDVLVKYCGHGTNLHRAWDSDMISSAGLTEDQYRAHVEGYVDGLSDPDLAKIQSGTPTDWVLEAHKEAVDDSYKVPADKDLCGAYTDTNLPIVDRQLADAGLRLAKVLNDAFAK